jgi:hypothetical protein
MQQKLGVVLKANPNRRAISGGMPLLHNDIVDRWSGDVQVQRQFIGIQNRAAP